jgi:NTE family protein
MAIQGAPPPRETLGDWLSREPFALTMSSGFFSFFAHTGFLSALTRQGLRPSRLSGSSAGALVAGAWASGLDPEDLERELTNLSRADFWDPGVGLGLLRGDRFLARLEAMFPQRSFARCRAPLALSVHDVRARRAVVVDAGDLPLAVRASCSFPGLFHPVRLGGRLVIDGGASDRPGLAGMVAGARVLYHHIASRSPWRRAGSAALAVPARKGLVALVIEGLPRSGPFALDAGRRALALAREATLRALDAPVEEAIVRIAAGGRAENRLSG